MPNVLPFPPHPDTALRNPVTYLTASMLYYRKSFPEHGPTMEEFQNALVRPRKLISAESDVPEHNLNRGLQGSFYTQSRISSASTEEINSPTLGAKTALREPIKHLSSVCSESFQTRDTLQYVIPACPVNLR